MLAPSPWNLGWVGVPDHTQDSVFQQWPRVSAQARGGTLKQLNLLPKLRVSPRVPVHKFKLKIRKYYKGFLTSLDKDPY